MQATTPSMEKSVKARLLEAGLPTEIDAILGKKVSFTIEGHPMHTDRHYMGRAADCNVRQGSVSGVVVAITVSKSERPCLYIDSYPEEKNGKPRPYLCYDGPENGWRWYEQRPKASWGAPWCANSRVIEHPGTLTLT